MVIVQLGINADSIKDSQIYEFIDKLFKNQNMFIKNSAISLKTEQNAIDPQETDHFNSDDCFNFDEMDATDESYENTFDDAEECEEYTISNDQHTTDINEEYITEECEEYTTEEISSTTSYNEILTTNEFNSPISSSSTWSTTSTSTTSESESNSSSESSESNMTSSGESSSVSSESSSDSSESSSDSSESNSSSESDELNNNQEINNVLNNSKHSEIICTKDNINNLENLEKCNEKKIIDPILDKLSRLYLRRHQYRANYNK